MLLIHTPNLSLWLKGAEDLEGQTQKGDFKVEGAEPHCQAQHRTNGGHSVCAGNEYLTLGGWGEFRNRNKSKSPAS